MMENVLDASDSSLPRLAARSGRSMKMKDLCLQTLLRVVEPRDRVNFAMGFLPEEAIDLKFVTK
jgi:hypothetical protein